MGEKISKVSKIFLETSVFIRYFTADDEKKFADCVHLLETIEKAGTLRPYTSNIVILEILFVLTRVYKFPKKEVLEGIQKILDIRNLTLIEKADTLAALEFYKKHNIKFGDCLIATQIPTGVKLVSYDEEFEKIKIPVLTPVEFL